MTFEIRRRDFLTWALTGISLPSLWPLTATKAQTAPANAGLPEDQPGLWDYVSHPVTVTNPAVPDTWNVSSKFAFDGYGGSRQPNAVAHLWIQEGKPTEVKPFFCTIDYGSPVQVTKFVHYFFAPRVRDYRPDPLMLPSAWDSVNIYRSDDGASWTLAEQVKALPPIWPQVLTLSEPRSARYYKLEITGLAAGAEGLRTYEVETLTGPAIHNPSIDSGEAKLGEACNLHGRVVGTGELVEYTVSAAASKEIEIAGNAARVDAGGSFNLTIRPLRAGIVPVMLELANQAQAVVDRRRLNLLVVPRVSMTDVKLERETLVGRLSNSATTSVAVRVESGANSRYSTKLAPGASSAFHLKVTNHGDGQLVELKLWEGGQASSDWVFAVEREGVAKEGSFQNEKIKAEWSTEAEEIRLRLTPSGARQPIQSTLHITFDDVPMSFSVSQQGPESATLLGPHKEGLLECTLQPVGSSVQASFRNLREGIQQETIPGKIEIRLKTDGVRFRFVPAYVYSKEPISELRGIYSKEPLSTIRSGCAAPTRMAALETEAGTLALVPDRDRCLMGIDQDDAVVRLRMGQEPAKVLVSAVAGDWFESFRYVVENVYDFKEPRQFRPLIEAVSGEANYLTHNQDIWNRKMNVLTSFPNRDYVFVFYGLTFTVPALYSWYQMSGDPQALERARDCVRWLKEFPGERVEDGPAAGAFFSQYGLPGAENCCGGGDISPGGLVNGGGDAGNNPFLEPHATGVSVWILLYHYLADGRKDQQALAAAKAGADWLLKVQNPNGGWDYAFRVDGSKVTDVEGAGNIWSIWALHRLGKLTGEQKYLEAAERGKKWFGDKFVAQHICNGYWEDSAGGHSGAGVGTSWEAYEFGVAANVFAEMGDKELAIGAAKNAVTWIWTRVIECRDYFNSVGHAHEQYFWPPATYVAPMFGLAAQTAYRLSGDEFFHRFAGAAKTIGWWTVRETDQGIFPHESTKAELGGSFWPLEGTEFVPLEGPLTVSYWVDWITSQQTANCVRWLINEVNQRSAGKIAVDADTLAGTVLGAAGKVSLRPKEISVEAENNQVNWLGYRTEASQVLALINDEEETTAKLMFPALGSSAAQVLTSADGKSWQETKTATGNSIEVKLPARGCALIVWNMAGR